MKRVKCFVKKMGKAYLKNWYIMYSPMIEAGAPLCI